MSRDKRDFNKSRKIDFFASTVAKWDRVEGTVQASFQRLVKAHAGADPFYLSVAQQLSDGVPVSPKQAATLLRIADNNGWSMPIA